MGELTGKKHTRLQREMHGLLHKNQEQLGQTPVRKGEHDCFDSLTQSLPHVHDVFFFVFPPSLPF